MWMNNRKTVYFYRKNFRCYNINEKKLFTVDAEHRKRWETSGNSTRIAADCLADWKD